MPGLIRSEPSITHRGGTDAQSALVGSAVWYLLRTAAGGHTGMTIGIEVFREIRDLRLDRMLIQPLVCAVGPFPINRRD